MTTPPSLVIHSVLAGFCLVLAGPWFIWVRYWQPDYDRRHRAVNLAGLALVVMILLHGLLVYGFVFGFGWSNQFGDGFGDGYMRTLPLLGVEFALVLLFVGMAVVVGRRERIPK